MEDVRYECKLSVINNKKQNTKANINKCDCIVDFITEEFLNIKDQKLPDTEQEAFEKNLSKKMEKKCGKIPDFMKQIGNGNSFIYYFYYKLYIFSFAFNNYK